MVDSRENDRSLATKDLVGVQGEVGNGDAVPLGGDSKIRLSSLYKNCPFVRINPTADLGEGNKGDCSSDVIKGVATCTMDCLRSLKDESGDREEPRNGDRM